MKRTRTVLGLALAGGLLVVTWLVVLPAIASSGPTGQAVPPPSSAGVTPTDVARGAAGTDCSVFHPGYTGYSLYIADPESGTYKTTVNGSTYTFKIVQLTRNISPSLPAFDIDKYMNISSPDASAQITDVGIDGGSDENRDIRGVTDETRYDYSKVSGGFVTSDNNLHPPAQSINSRTGQPTSLYSYSHVTFCFRPKTATVSGTVYRDANQNNTNDDSSPLAGWTVNLYAGTTLSQHTTTTNGAYSFSVPVSSTGLTVCEVRPDATWTQTQSGAAACSGSGESAKGYSVTASTPGGTYGGNDFGNVQLASISGTAFNDVDGNGKQDSGDAGLGGLTATLYNSVTKASTPATTDGNGNYSFTNQVAGNSYTVCISTPSGGTYKQTVPTSGGGCSSGQGANGLTFSLDPAGNTGELFGFQPQGSISGTVYNDANQNGVNDSGEPGQGGWTINLYDATNALVKSTTSASDGSYSLNLPLTSSSYTVCEAPPSDDWAQSEPLPSSDDLCHGTSPADNSAVNELPKGYNPTGAAEGAVITGKDFGNVPAHSGSTGTITSTDQAYTVTLGQPKDNNFVVDSGVLDGKPFVSLWAGDSTQSKFPMIESITWDYPGTGQNGITVQYTDIFPFSTTNLHDMQYCLRDPTDDVTAWSGGALPSGVLPASTAGDPEATSCLISTGHLAGGKFVAHVYSAVDGFRTTG